MYQSHRQGANQALTDGPLLANWLQRASIDSAVKGFWREIVDRTAPVVAASRKAAKELHSPGILQYQGFAGVQPGKTHEFLSTLKARGIGANLGATLDETIQATIQEYNVGSIESERPISVDQQSKALEYAAVGDTQGLRLLSLAKHSESIRTAKDSQSRTCLHLAAIGGHKSTCQWLLTEMDCDGEALDGQEKKAIEYAAEHGNEALVRLFQTLQKEPQADQ